MPKVYKGKLRNWREDKGFGFLIHDGGADIFMHVTDVDDGDRNRTKFRDGDRFTFEEGEDKSGKLIAKHAVWLEDPCESESESEESYVPSRRRSRRSRSHRRRRHSHRDDSRPRRGRRRR